MKKYFPAKIIFRYGAIFVIAAQAMPLAAAEPILDLGRNDGHQISVTLGSANKKVGNAVLVTLYSVSGSLSIKSNHLIACDGSWITSGIKPSISVRTKPFTPYSEESAELDPVDFFDSADAGKVYGNVKAHASKLCKTASSEPRNFIIPIAITPERNNEASTSSGVVTGGSIIKGDSVDIWVRKSDFRYAPLVDEDGNARMLDGVAQRYRTRTGDYSMSRTTFNCAELTSATYEHLQYTNNNSTPTSQSLPRENARSSPVVPGSIGEAMLEAVCRIYGKARKNGS